MSSLVQAVVFAAMWGDPLAGGLTRIDLEAAGRLLGLYRVRRSRRSGVGMAAQASMGRAPHDHVHRPGPWASTIRLTVPSRPAHLPDFERPPLAEVAMGVLFSPLHLMRQAHFGRYWDRVREDFPRVEDQPAIEPQYELDDEPVGVAVNFRLSVAPPLRRSWFISRGEDELLQLQPDRFVDNWRRAAPAAREYPRFEALWDRFSSRWEDLGSFVEDEGLGQLVPEQVELTYVNVVDDVPIADGLHHAPGGPFSLPDGGGVLRPEQTQSAIRYKIAASSPARLYVQTSTTAEGWNMELTYKQRLPSGEALRPSFFRGREVIDHAFLGLTTAAAQQVWGIKT